MDIFAIVLDEMKDNLSDVGLTLSQLKDGINNANEKALLRLVFDNVLYGALRRRQRLARDRYISQIRRENPGTSWPDAITIWFERTYQALLA